ncbi:MAG: hypothetical protein ACI9XO_004256 [Paraglaciecola sp.]|jgi:hypothetical protein
MNPILSTSGRPIETGLNELNFPFFRNNSVSITVNKVSSEHRKCQIYFGENDSFLAWSNSVKLNYMRIKS